MRYLSNFFLQAAYYTRKVKDVQNACIRAACRARIFELKHWPEPVVETADEVLDRIRESVGGHSGRHGQGDPGESEQALFHLEILLALSLRSRPRARAC